jgi:hypothetical protein
LFWNIAESVARKKYFPLKGIRERNWLNAIGGRFERRAGEDGSFLMVAMPDDPLATCSAMARAVYPPWRLC